MPLALVAIYPGTIVGIISLKLQYLAARPQFSPWMGGLFVVAAYPGRGVGTAVIRRLLQEASRLQLGGFTFGGLQLRLFTQYLAGYALNALIIAVMRTRS